MSFDGDKYSERAREAIREAAEADTGKAKPLFEKFQKLDKKIEDLQSKIEEKMSSGASDITGIFNLVASAAMLATEMNGLIKKIELESKTNPAAAETWDKLKTELKQIGEDMAKDMGGMFPGGGFPDGFPGGGFPGGGDFPFPFPGGGKNDDDFPPPVPRKKKDDVKPAEKPVNKPAAPKPPDGDFDLN